MKKLLIAILGLFTMPFSVYAATPESILEAEDMILVKYDPTEAPELLTDTFEYFFGISTGMAMYQDAADLALQEYMIDLFLTKPLTVSISSFSEITQEPEKYFLFMELSSSEFTSKLLPQIETTDTITESMAGETTIYSIADEFSGEESGAFTQYEGQLIFGDTAESLKDLITSKKQKLSADADFEKIGNNVEDENFFFVYASGLEGVLAELSQELEVFMPFLGSINAEGLSVSQTLKGIKIRSYMTQDAEKVAASGLDFSNDDELTLHKLLPNNDIIYFYNGKNIIGWSEVVNELTTASMGSELGEEFESGMETFLLLLDKEMAMVMEDNGALLPAITFLSDITNNSSKLEPMVTAMIESAWEELSFEADSKSGSTLTFKENEGTFTVTRKKVKVGGKEIDQFSFNFQFAQSKNPYAIQMPVDLFNFKITIGVTDDDVFLFSTNSKIATEYGSGASEDQKIKLLLEDNPDEVSYMNIRNLEDYLQNIVSRFAALMPEEKVNFDAIAQNITNALEPWTSIESVSNFSNTFVASESNINVDFEMAAKNYQMDKWLPVETNGIDRAFTDGGDFDDVSTAEWFGDDVYYLTSKGVINGYPDGTFKPTQSINRAEFTKLIIEVLQNEGIIEPNYYYYESPFSDVDYSAWYFDVISQAKEAAIIGGYQDGTFHPEGNISRAEAASIISNVLKTYGISKLDVISFGEFKDVTQEKWYNVAITDITKAGIMSGKNADYFGPDENLNRAEAAKIIRNLIELIQAQ